MAFLSSLLRRQTPAVTEDDITKQRKATELAIQQYGRKIGRGLRAFGNTPQDPKIRYNTPDQEDNLPLPGTVPLGAENLAPSEQNPLRTLSIEGQARANARATNDPVVEAATTNSPMGRFFADHKNPYGTIDNRIAPVIKTDMYGNQVSELSQPGRPLTAKEYAASMGRGPKSGILRWNKDESDRIQNAQYMAGLRSAENVAQSEADAAKALAVGRLAGEPKVGMFKSENRVLETDPVTGVVTKRGVFRINSATGEEEQVAEYSYPPGLSPSDQIALDDLQKERGEILASGGLDEKFGPDWNPLAKTNREKLKSVDERIAKITGNAASAPTLQKALSEEEASAILAEAGGDPVKAREIAKSRGYTF